MAKYFILSFSLIFIALFSSPAACQEPEVMNGLYGMYPINREASGTSWQPASTPRYGTTRTQNELSILYYGQLNGGYVYQTGGRGEDSAFTTGLFQTAAQYPLEDGTFGFRLGLSPDALNGDDGFPLLLQSGYASGGQRLIDRQAGYDLLSEFAFSYSFPVSEYSSAFFYAGYPGEPALGPPSHLARFSGRDIPVAPISRYWLESTRTCYGVLTGGYTTDFVKLEASIFNAREPDASHLNLELDEPKFKSYSGRAAFNAAPNVSWDFSVGHLSEPDRLVPLLDINRISSALIINSVGDDHTAQTTLAWGRNIKHPGGHGDAYMIESTLRFKTVNTYFARLERVEKDNLFPLNSANANRIFTVYKADLGYIRDFPFYGLSVWGLGGSLGLNYLPQSLETAYGERLQATAMVFVRWRL